VASRYNRGLQEPPLAHQGNGSGGGNGRR
jgi:hypothetical protein